MSEQVKKLLPKLRFPEFQNDVEWQFIPLNKIAKRCINKNRNEQITRVLTNSAEFGVVDQRDFFDKDIATQGNLDGYYIVEEGDYVYNPRISSFAPVGPISKNKIGLGVMSPLYTVFRFDKEQNDFYSLFFKSTGWHLYMRQASSTGARHDRMAISNEAFMDMPIPVTGNSEQQKIADCLSSLDDLITAQNQKVESLKQHKKGLMQQLFPEPPPAKGEYTEGGRGLVPKIRFPEFENDVEWKLIPLNKIAKRCINKNRNEQITRVLTNSAEFGVVDQRDFFDKDIATQGNLDGYYIVEEGDYVYNPRISSFAPVGPISKNKIGLGVMSPLYTVFRFDKEENDFYSLFFKSTGWHHYMRQASSTGARHDRMAISNEAFMGMPIPVTSNAEQQKIANFLTSLDDLITTQTQQLEAYKTHKKGLMQQLFPDQTEAS